MLSQKLVSYSTKMFLTFSFNSLKSMFDSPQFEESISSFQKILADGVFDNTVSGLKLEDCRMLKRFVLCNLSKSKWVEHYNLLKVCTGFLELLPIGKIY